MRTKEHLQKRENDLSIFHKLLQGLKKCQFSQGEATIVFHRIE